MCYRKKLGLCLIFLDSRETWKLLNRKNVLIYSLLRSNIMARLAESQNGGRECI